MLEKLGQYRIIEPIGVDPTGELYRARDLRAGRTVSIRLMPETIGDARQQGELRERASAMMSWSHPSIAAIYEVGEDAGRVFVVSEFVPGQPLSELTGGRPLNPRRAIGYAIQLADALAVAHAEGAVHGNIHATNVVITPKGVAKFPDFGLWPRETADAAADSRADVASLGALLLEMLAGREPGAGSMQALPANLGSIVQKMVGNDPAKRFESAATVASELRAAADSLEARDAGGEFSETRFDGSAQVVTRRRRNTMWLIATALVAAALTWVVRLWLR